MSQRYQFGHTPSMRQLAVAVALGVGVTGSDEKKADGHADQAKGKAQKSIGRAQKKIDSAAKKVTSP